ncbi:signal peptidase I [Prosthecobacter sp. SYSU 5D2]|uniref:signal peptidase I n=1 Tax=Prosthecobacter sp. SYSU 5D2 TaxID=3134134 RepID=UPI0031FF3A4B
MHTLPSNELALGPVSKRKPSTAINLSLFLPGLGQVYCGALGRGLLHLCALTALLVVALVFLAAQSVPPKNILITVAILSVIPTAYSTWDARRMALASREDYRLKDYNRISVYVALIFLTMPIITGLGFSVRENFLHIFTMTGSSMSPTFDEGDRIFVRKDSYRDRQPEHNDLVAFLNPANRRQTWVKRVIALPGDVLEIKEGIVHLNGMAIKEAVGVHLDKTNLPPITIPDHHCYVLGDNRADSKDSRHIGPVPMIALVGNVLSWR